MRNLLLIALLLLPACTKKPQEVRVLKALLTPAEFAKFEAGDGVDEDSLVGRKCQVEVFVKENGWPGIGNVIAARKARSSK